MQGKTVGALSAILFILIAIGVGYYIRFQSSLPEKEVAVATVASEVTALVEDVSTAQMGSYDIRDGFTSASSLTPQEFVLACPAELPAWLKGYLVGTGPALYDLGGTSNKYWFNGLAQLYSIDIDAPTCTFRSAFLESTFFTTTLKEGKFGAGVSAAEPSSSWFSKLAQACTTKEPYDNGNLAVSVIGSTCVAHTETPVLICFDPLTLKTQQKFIFNDSLSGHLCPARYCYDPFEDAWYSFLLEFNKTSVYRLFKLPNKAPYVREEIAAITTKEPSYMRAMGLTKQHMILVEVPFVVNPFDLLFSTGCFVDQVCWKPSLQTKITVLSKKTGQAVAAYTMPAFYTFEIVNAFDDNAKVVVDLIKYPDASIIKHTALSKLRSESYPAFPAGNLTRITLDLSSGALHETELMTCHGFCTFNRAQKTMADYRYVYALSSTIPHHFPNQLIKFDKETGTISQWSAAGCFPSAPLFVQQPEAQQEDDGVLLSIVFDSKARHSFVLVLAARTFAEIGRINLPVVIPLGFAGMFLRKK
jgi:beta,beta-carotene 9',10'-dioxygenase